jgi:ABC-type polysaccharide transport system permease subunit
MKQFSLKVLYTLNILLAVLVLGFFIPTVLSVFISVFTEVTFSQCVQSVIYWVFSIIGTVAAMSYINDLVTDTDKEKF